MRRWGVSEWELIEAVKRGLVRTKADPRSLRITAGQRAHILAPRSGSRFEACDDCEPCRTFGCNAHEGEFPSTPRSGRSDGSTP